MTTLLPLRNIVTGREATIDLSQAKPLGHGVWELTVKQVKDAQWKLTGGKPTQAVGFDIAGPQEKAFDIVYYQQTIGPSSPPDKAVAVVGLLENIP